jgi:hypothetical protein
MIDEREAILKSMAAEMAAALSREPGAATLSLMQRFGLLSEPTAGSAANAGALHPDAIGIWEPRGPAAPGFYDRSEIRRDLWTLWADVPTLAPKDERRRIVLLGESPAYGFFYAPAFSPAKVLESLLPSALGAATEVIDLARSGISAAELVAVTAAALRLQPDAYVIVAGNNWTRVPPPKSFDRCLQAKVLREGGAKGFKKLRERALAALVIDSLRQKLHQLSAAVPIVLVVPEFNLGDWPLDMEQDAPWLPTGHNRRWLECRTAAREALAAGELDAARALGSEMLDLDQGTAAGGWAILADCERAAGDLTAARGHLEKARDAHLWHVGRRMPRTHAIIQEALRGCASPRRISVVDLPRLFAALRPGELPDRELFLDFCDMSSTGIRIAMAAAAAELAELLGGPSPRPSTESLLLEAPWPLPRIEAEARFAAAIFNAVMGGTGAMTSFLCREAARRSSEVTRTMQDFLAARVSRLPAWASPAVARAFSATSTHQLKFLLLPANQRTFSSAVLLSAVADGLESAGIPARALLDELWRGEWRPDEPQDLLAVSNSSHFVDEDWIWETGYFFRAHSPISRFPWIGRAAEAVAFDLTCRRTAEVNAECQVLVNGEPLVEISPGSSWETFRFHAAAERVRPGLNWLEIRWSLDLPPTEDAIEGIARDLESGRTISLRPVFAEIHFLRAARYDCSPPHPASASPAVPRAPGL